MPQPKKYKYLLHAYSPSSISLESSDRNFKPKYDILTLTI